MIQTELKVSNNILSAQVTVTDAATLLFPERAFRNSGLLLNTDATVNMFIGGSTVTITTGYRVKAGEAIEYTAFNALYAVVASGTIVAHTIEEFGI